MYWGFSIEIPNFIIKCCALRVRFNETKRHLPDPWRLHSEAASHCLLRWTGLYPTTAAAMVMVFEKHGLGQIFSKKKKAKVLTSMKVSTHTRISLFLRWWEIKYQIKNTCVWERERCFSSWRTSGFCFVLFCSGFSLWLSCTRAETYSHFRIR